MVGVSCHLIETKRPVVGTMGLKQRIVFGPTVTKLCFSEHPRRAPVTPKRKCSIYSHSTLKLTWYLLFRYQICNQSRLFCVLIFVQSFHIMTILNTLDQTLSSTSVLQTWPTRTPMSILRRLSKCCLLLLARLVPYTGGLFLMMLFRSSVCGVFGLFVFCWL